MNIEIVPQGYLNTLVRSTNSRANNQKHAEMGH